MEIAELDIPELRDPPFTPQRPGRAARSAALDLRRDPRARPARPPSVRFVLGVASSASSQSAATDEHVLAIKLTLYRTSGDTAIVRALDRGGAARQAGRGADRAQGARSTRRTTSRGRARSRTPACTSRSARRVLKTHTKTALVVRREPDGIRRYVHLGTRQLQLAHGAALHRRRAVHLQPVDRRRRERSVQLAHRLSRASGCTASCSSRRRT